MSHQIKPAHYYHADANALGGVLTRPTAQMIEVQSQVSLPAVGGVTHVRNGRYQLFSALAVDATEAQASGAPNALTDCPETMAMSKAEGLNVMHILSADLVVGQILSSHPCKPGAARVTFAGTQIQGLRVAGNDVTVTLDLDIFDHVKHLKQDNYPSAPAIQSSNFLNKLPGQPAGVPSVLTTLVTKINGYSGGVSGNALDVPGLGTVYLAELLVSAVSYHLIMMRLELGCPTQGSVSVAVAKVNGGGH